MTLCGCAGSGAVYTSAKDSPAPRQPGFPDSDPDTQTPALQTPGHQTPASSLADIRPPAELLRQSSATAALRGARGCDFDPALPHSLCSADGHYGVFSPSYTPGSTGTGGLAFAVYRLSLSGYSGPANLDVVDDAGGPLSNCWVGVSDFQQDRWRWFPAGAAGLADLAPISRYLGQQSGEMLVVVAVTGSTQQKLKYLRVGGNLAPIAAISATPPGGAVPLPLHLDASASYDMDGEIASYSFHISGSAKSPPAASPQYDLVAQAVSDWAYVDVVDDSASQSTASLDLPLGTASLQSWPGDGLAELPVCLRASANCEGRAVVSYEFDPLGDGSFSSPGAQRWIDTVYSSAGAFQATARITDAEGNTYLASTPVSVAPDDGNPRWRLVVPDAWQTLVPLLTTVGGRPAIAAIGDGNLYYMRALDGLGKQWGPGTLITSGVDFSAGNMSMAEVAGCPAVLYMRDASDGQSRELYYRRALDPDGQSWSDERLLRIWTSAFWAFASLAVINGNPAVVSLSNEVGGVQYRRASDPQGDSWGAPVTVWMLEHAFGCCLLEVQGRPAIGFTYGGVYYSRAGDADGLSWPDTKEVAPYGSNGTWYPTMAVLNGVPAIAYCAAGQGAQPDYEETLCLVRAQDATGAAWYSSQALKTQPGVFGRYSSMLSISGTPSIAFFSMDPNNGQEPDGGTFCSALDADGASWGEPFVFDESWGDFNTLIEVSGGRPAVASSSLGTAFWVYY